MKKNFVIRKTKSLLFICVLILIHQQETRADTLSIILPELSGQYGCYTEKATEIDFEQEFEQVLSARLTLVGFKKPGLGYIFELGEFFELSSPFFSRLFDENSIMESFVNPKEGIFVVQMYFNYDSFELLTDGKCNLELLTDTGTPAFYSWQMFKSPNIQLKHVELFIEATPKYNEAISLVSQDNPSLVLANFPNPFNPETRIRYQLAQQSRVELNVHNILGEKVATLVNGLQEAGAYSVTFNAATLPSGMYVYQFKAGSFIQTRKMILMK